MTPPNAAGLREEIRALVLQSAWSPASGPVEWDAAKTYATLQQADYLADCIMARVAQACQEPQPLPVEGGVEGVAWDRKRACEAAALASARFGQWVPQAWLDHFMKAYEEPA